MLEKTVACNWASRSRGSGTWRRRKVGISVDALARSFRGSHTYVLAPVSGASIAPLGGPLLLSVASAGRSAKMARLPPALSLALAVLVACGAGPRVVAAELVVGCAWDINSRCSSDREVFCGTFETDACVPIEVSGFPLFGKITAVGNGRYSMGIALSESACDQDVLIELIPAGAKGECFPIEKASIITVNLDFGLLQDSTATAAPSTTSIAVSTPCPPASPANCRQGSESFCTRGADGCQRCSCRLAEVSTTPAAPLATKVTGCIYGLGSGCTGESQGCADYEIDACTVQEMNSIDVYLLVTRGEAPGTYNLGASLSAQSCSNGLTIPVVAGAAVGDCSAVEKISFLTVNLDIGLSTFVDPEASTRAPTTDAPATSAPGVGKDCREDSNCKNCDGASGRCEKCGNFMYLHQGECIAACPTTLATWGVGKAGLECVAPFTCSLADGCECPLGGCEECEVLAGAGNVQCLSCDASRYLVAGKCKKDVFCRGTQVWAPRAVLRQRAARPAAIRSPARAPVPAPPHVSRCPTSLTKRVTLGRATAVPPRRRTASLARFPGGPVSSEPMHQSCFDSLRVCFCRGPARS